MKPLYFGILKRLQSMSVVAHTVRLVAQSRISFVHFRSLSVILNRKRFSGRFTFILGSETKSLRSTDSIRIRAVRLGFPLSLSPPPPPPPLTPTPKFHLILPRTNIQSPTLLSRLWVMLSPFEQNFHFHLTWSNGCLG